MAKKKNKEDNYNPITTFYYNHKILIWILIIILIIVLILKYVSSNRKGIVPIDYDINLKIEDKENLYVGIGNSINLRASINVPDAEIIWSSSDTNIVKVNNGTVTGVNYGKAKIMVSYIDIKGNKYLDSCFVEVVDGDENVSLIDISFPSGDLYMPVNNEYRINLVLNPSNAIISEKTFSSSDDRIVSVTNDGVIRSHHEGSARIIATVNGRFQASIDVYVSDNYKKSEIVLSPSSIDFDTDTRKIKAGSSEKLYYSINPSNADRSKLTWSSDEPSIVTVDQNGVIKGIKEGETIVSVKGVNGKSANIVIEVYNDIVPVEDIVISPTNINIEAGKTITINPVVKPSNASNKGLSYSSADPSVVSVSVNGLGDTATLSALKKGNTVVVIRSGSIEKRITVNVTGNNNNSEIDEDENTLPTTIKVRSNKNNLAKTYLEAEKIPVSGTSTISVSLSIGVGKIKYCYNKYGNSACTPNIEKFADTTVTIPSGSIYVLRIIKYDYNGKIIESSSPNYSNGVLSYYINTKSPDNIKLYTVTGAYDSTTLASASPSKIGDKVTIKVNDSNRHLSICYANGKSCTPNTRVNSTYTINIDSTGTTRIYVNEYDNNDNKIGNTEIYYVYVNENDEENIEVSDVNVYNQTLVGKYLTATTTSGLSFNEVRFCYKTVTKNAIGTCNLDIKASVPIHNGGSYFHPQEENKTYYASFSLTSNKVFWFDIDGLDRLYDTSDTNKDVIFEYAIKTSKGYSNPIKIRINMTGRNGANSSWKTTFIN